MAEPAVGAVNVLLGVIRNEAQLLGGVRADVQFIKEEMQSMKSFLAHLSRTAPPGGEHDEQVRTWMDQVRHLALDCSGCIDLYLYRGNREIHRARGGLSRYFLWLPWYLQKMVAQHHAAIQLRELKDRARDVGERRCRYGVELPANVLAGRWSTVAGLIAAATTPSLASAHAPVATGGEAPEDDEADELVVARAAGNSGRSGAFFETPTVENSYERKLEDWMKRVSQGSIAGTETSIPSLAIVAKDNEETLAIIAHEAEAMAAAHCMRSVFVDIPALHLRYHDTRLPRDILYYILWEVGPKPPNTQPSSQQREEIAGHQGKGEELDVNERKDPISSKKFKLIDEIKEKIQGIISRLEQMKSGRLESGRLGINLKQMNDALVDLPLWLLKLEQAGNSPLMGLGNGRKEAAYGFEWYNDIIKKTAKKLKEHMEAPPKKEHLQEEEEEEEEGLKPIRLDDTRYEQILQEVFPMTGKAQHTLEQATMATTTTTSSTIALGEDQIKGLIHKILRELQEDKSVKKQETAHDKPGQNQIPDSPIIDATVQKIVRIGEEIEEQLLVDKIKDRLKHDDQRILVILKLDHDYLAAPEKIRNALSLLGRVAGALMLTTASSNTRLTKEYCYPPSQEPIDYSLVGLYRGFILEHTSQRMNEDNKQIISDILDKCKPDGFCMKMFAHALYANPRRSNKELKRLHSTLQFPPKSFGSISKMFKFSYSDLPEEYKSCLLYLAIFPQGHNITRSTLIGRWVAEGLVTREDWLTSVREAERCFDVLIDRWLVYPCYIGATGKVKGCRVCDPVYELITKIAKKQHILDTRLSHHLARHFSIFNNLRLRRSDGIDKFFQSLSQSSQVSLIKVLDLEGCHFWGMKQKSQRYLKDICNKMLLLKYLSLRGTNVTYLPSEINNLHELEVLDIRQTKVPESAIVQVLLLKLKRLLAGHICPTPSSSNTSTILGYHELSSVRIPAKIGKMVNMEVLSNVNGMGHDLREIGKLWQLRKLGVVIDDKHSQLKNLLQAISDLHECLQSLSIALENKGTPSNGELPSDISSEQTFRPKHLKSLSISGTTKRARLLPWFVIDDGQLAKVTLSNTWLEKEDLDILASLPTLQYLKLRRGACSESKLTFKNGEFPKLKYILVEGSNITDISFDGGAPELEKIVLPFTGLKLNGVQNLTKLEELELTNNTSSTTTTSSTLLSLFKDAKQITKMTLHGTLLKQDDLQQRRVPKAQSSYSRLLCHHQYQL